MSMGEGQFHMLRRADSGKLGKARGATLFPEREAVDDDIILSIRRYCHLEYNCFITVCIIVTSIERADTHRD